MQQFIDMGIDVYSSAGTFEALNLTGYRLHALESEKTMMVGPFKILPFPVEHDCTEPFGYLINHPECGNVLFATDTGFLQYKFAGLNQILIECNYSDDILDENIRRGNTPALIRKRVLNSHMELSVLLGILKANDLSAVNKIVLIHLSDGNSDAEKFQKTVEEATGKNVFIAAPGMDIHFDKTPF